MACCDCGSEDIQELFDNNRVWARGITRINPHYFDDMSKGQHPKYLWVGCADSRVVPDQMTGLLPGDIFVHRNVGNLAKMTDPNCMSALEYSVNALKVRHIVVCGHYNCGAVQAALKLPSKAPGIVNFWISDIRDVRNAHQSELNGLPADQQLTRLCELNVVKQTFNVCTSPVVQAAWDRGQELHVHGMIYELKTGLLKPLVGPISSQSAVPNDEDDLKEAEKPGRAASALSSDDAKIAEQLELHKLLTKRLSLHLKFEHGSSADGH